MNNTEKKYLKDFKKIEATNDDKAIFFNYITNDIDIMYSFVKKNNTLFIPFERKKDDICKLLENIESYIKSLKNTHICLFNNKCKNANLCGYIHDYKFIQLVSLYRSLQDCFNKIVKHPSSNTAFNFMYYLNTFEVTLWTLKSGCEYKKNFTQ